MKEARIITSKDAPRGIVYGTILEKVRQRNENPVFDEEKPYAFINTVKTSTQVHGWLFVYANRFFVATYHTYFGATSCVSIYESNKKGDFNCTDPIDSYPLYCDIETVVDLFCEKNKHLLEEEIAK